MTRVRPFRRGASAEGDAFEPALALEGISVTFGRRSALQDVSIRLGAGELVVLLGPNGAGKTTLSLIVAGLVRPDAGSVRIAGIGLGDRPSAALASIGLVFQQPTLDLERSVDRNLLFHADLQGLPRASARRRIEEELARFGLSEAAHRAARELSGGNRRRVELARALLHSPAVLFLDEPTSGLDPASRRDLLRHVRMLCSDREVAALWATNLVEEAEPADRIVVLQHGRVLTEAHPRDLRLRGGATTLNEAFLALTGAEPTLHAAE